MNIAIVSAFRNSSSRLLRYFLQVQSLLDHAKRSDPNAKIRVIAVEGDSTDRTRHELRNAKKVFNVPFKVDLVVHDHGKREFSSTEDVDRLEALTGVMKAGMSAVDFRDDVVLYVESDLIWHPHQVGSLIDMALRQDYGFDIFAPMIWSGKDHLGQRIFYDIWGFRKNGARFSPFYPYSSEYLNNLHLSEIDSAGSCLAFRSEIAEKVVVSGSNGLVSWCESARKQGYRIAVAPQFYVEHP